MPRISEFFGIIVYMYWKDIENHSLPHIHIRYSGEEAVFDFDGNILAGKLTKRSEKLSKEWINERREDLNFAWSKAITGKEIPWIAPIR